MQPNMSIDMDRWPFLKDASRPTNLPNAWTCLQAASIRVCPRVLVVRAWNSEPPPALGHPQRTVEVVLVEVIQDDVEALEDVPPARLHEVVHVQAAPTLALPTEALLLQQLQQRALRMWACAVSPISRRAGR